MSTLVRVVESNSQISIYNKIEALDLSSNLKERVQEKSQEVTLFSKDSQSEALKNKNVGPLSVSQSLENLDNLNSELHKFSKAAGNPDTTFNFSHSLLLMAKYYQQSLQEAFQKGNIPSEETQKVMLSTFLDSQISENQENPKTYYLMFLLHRFLERSATDPAWKTVARLISNCVQILYAIRVANYIPEETVPGIFCADRLKEIFKERLINLKENACTTLPGGWIDLPEQGVNGHFVLYLVRRQNPTEWKRIRIDTHSNPVFQEDIITADKIDQFVQNMSFPYFKKSFEANIQSIPLQKRIAWLSNLNKAAGTAFDSVIPTQKTAKNCVFTAWLALADYLMQQTTDRPHEEIENEMMRVSHEFREYLKPYLN